MDIDSSVRTNKAAQTQNIGREFARTILGQVRAGEGGPFIFCLYGDLGSGKTTFSKGFAETLGITSRLLSPTFIIVRRYEIPKSNRMFYHIDLYRVDAESMQESLGLEEILNDPDSVVLIEWADRLGNRIPKKRVDIFFESAADYHDVQWKRI